MLYYTVVSFVPSHMVGWMGHTYSPAFWFNIPLVLPDIVFAVCFCGWLPSPFYIPHLDTPFGSPPLAFWCWFGHSRLLQFPTTFPTPYCASQPSYLDMVDSSADDYPMPHSQPLFTLSHSPLLPQLFGSQDRPPVSHRHTHRFPLL